jgi:hypothetical protein
MYEIVCSCAGIGDSRWIAAELRSGSYRGVTLRLSPVSRPRTRPGRLRVRLAAESDPPAAAALTTIIIPVFGVQYSLFCLLTAFLLSTKCRQYSRFFYSSGSATNISVSIVIKQGIDFNCAELSRARHTSLEFGTLADGT